MRVLIVEDEREMADLLKGGLEEENHSVSVAFDGRTGLEYATSTDFDAIVLDLMLPGLDGFEVTRRLRKRKNQTPILVLTARDAIADIARALDLGADDYLTKPFSFVVLLARLRALARRGSSVHVPLMKVADLLMRRAGRVVSRNAIVNGVWGLEKDVDGNTLDAFVRLLRSKVDKDFEPKLVQTIRGFGYSVCEEPRP